MYVSLEYFLTVLYGNAMYFVEEFEHQRDGGGRGSSILLHNPILEHVPVGYFI